MERGSVPAPHHAHRVRHHDDRQGQEVHGVPADAGQRPHHSHGRVAAISSGCRLLPDGQQAKHDVLRADRKTSARPIGLGGECLSPPNPMKKRFFPPVLMSLLVPCSSLP